MAIHPAVAERLARLAPDQRAAATSPPGPILCVAPAGSGKTTTLVARVAWRIATGSVPEQVCAVTFNRRAAEELEERLDAALIPLGVAEGSVRVRTFHALGREILADAGVDVSRIVERAALLEELGGGPLPAAAIRHLDDAFTRLSLDPERGPPPEDVVTHAAWARYRAALEERGALDLDDLVARVGPALRADGALLARWRTRAAVLFVDETQDLDRTQLDLALLLCGERRDIFLVGDDDQTIYAWRLADVRRVLGLAASLPGLRRVDLVTNYQCPPEVVRRAARLVAHNRERFEKRILASPTAAGTLTLAPDPGEPLARARVLVSTWLARDEGTHAVLARTNKELAPFAALAIQDGIPHVIDDDGLCLDDPAIDVLLARAREIGDASVPLLLRLAAAARALAAAGTLHDVTGSVLAWAARYDRLEDLRSAVASARAARQSLREAGTGLVLATIHGTKGLEYDHVAVIGMDEDVFPSRRTIDEAEDPERAIEEERRLCYVAWTRARRGLVLVHDPDAPSVFLREAFDPPDLRGSG